jgi:hypothetical protein
MRVLEEFILDHDNGTLCQEQSFNQQVRAGMRKMTPNPRRLRNSFTPDALARFSRLFDEVWKELLEEGVLDATHDPWLARRRLAKTLFCLARSSWSDIQMRQLLIRAFRNEAARLQRAQLQSRAYGTQARAVAGTHASLPSLLAK